MPTPPDNPKFRRWQFSLRKFVLLVTLFSVLAVAGYRLREGGRNLSQQRITIEMGYREYSDMLALKAEFPVDEMAISANRSKTTLAEFDRKYWLPVKVYELTSNWD